MAMLKKGSILLVLFISISCLENSRDENFILLDFYRNTNASIRQKLSIMANDSINKWIKDSLAITKALIFDSYKINDDIIFNQDSSRMFTTINVANTHQREIYADYILDFGGAKIEGKWYFFFMGVSSPVVRSNWQDSVYAPLTFEELSYIAYEWNFKTLIKNINEGHPEKNEERFEDMFFDYYECKNSNDQKACSDSFILESVSGKYAYRLDPKEIAEIKRAMAESVRPPEPERSFWDKTFSKKKVFELEEWKDYLRKENVNKSK
jgi:hypothetical protein